MQVISKGIDGLNMVQAITTYSIGMEATIQVRDLDQEREEQAIKERGKRVKELLKEPANMVCSECVSKKNKLRFLVILKVLSPHASESRNKQVGVFCCKDCGPFFLALGQECCTVKNLKNPEEYTDQDVDILERTGNAMVNATYLNNNASIASAAFVESKYKHCLYFSEKIFLEQIKLRADTLEEQRKVKNSQEPSTDDKLRMALNRKNQASTAVAKAKTNPDEAVLLRGFNDTDATATGTDADAGADEATSRRSSRSPANRLRRVHTSNPDGVEAKTETSRRYRRQWPGS